MTLQSKQDIIKLHPETEVFWELWDLLQVRDGMLYKFFSKVKG